MCMHYNIYSFILRTLHILVEEVQKAVNKLKNNKSPGNDGITGEMIKHGGPHLIEEIHQTPTGIEPTVVDDDDDDASYQTA